MAIDINLIKQRLNSFKNTPKTSDLIWKPAPGKQVVRIVPYKFNPENPFIELKFYYKLNGKTFLSPDSFGKPDPIVELSNELKSAGDKESWVEGKKLEPKMRTYVPIIVRGQEKEGVKFWGFGKTVYQEIMSIIADPDYGDITDPKTGRDVVVEFKTAEEVKKNFPETSIRVKPNQTPAVDPSDKELIKILGDQTNIDEIFTEATYDELKVQLDIMLNGTPEAVNESPVEYNTGNTDTSEESTNESYADSQPTDDKKDSSEVKRVTQVAEVTDAFAELFGTE